MKKIEEFVIATLVLAFFVCSTACASTEILLSKPQEVYSLGDKLAIDLSIISSDDVEGLVSLILNCDGDKLLFFINSVSLTAKKKKSFDVPSLLLTKERGVGSCFVEALFENGISESKKSERFAISDSVDITFELEKEHFLPSEEIKIKGSAKKANGQAIDGTVTLVLFGNYTTSVTEGIFSFSMSLPSNASAGWHTFTLYIKDAEENKGSTKKEIYIKAVPTKIILGINKKSFMPYDLLIVKPSLLDQAESLIGENITIILRDPKGKEAESKEVLSGSVAVLVMPLGMPGDWLVEAYSAGLEEKMFVYMEEIEAINITLIDGMLHVMNIGNIPYTKPLAISFKGEGEEKTKTKLLDLKVGEEIEFDLKAPDGIYDIGIRSETENKSFVGIPLTGGVFEIGKKGFLNNYSPVIWLFVFVLLVAAIALFLHRKKEGKQVGILEENKKSEKTKGS